MLCATVNNVRISFMLYILYRQWFCNDKPVGYLRSCFLTTLKFILCDIGRVFPASITWQYGFVAGDKWDAERLTRWDGWNGPGFGVWSVKLIPRGQQQLWRYQWLRLLRRVASRRSIVGQLLPVFCAAQSRNTSSSRYLPSAFDLIVWQRTKLQNAIRKITETLWCMRPKIGAIFTVLVWSICITFSNIYSRN